MKAVRYHEYGPPEVLRVEDIPRPSPLPGQVLVKTESTCV
jgi:NADPH:quinone reductase-like Zn-dependent oxidoreductase